ncbi:MAG: serine/threonine-protein kinase [archaeon]
MTTLGNYKIIKQIGQGGFARAYEAEHTLLETKACLKQNINVSPQDTELMKMEAKVLWDIHHYSLPQIKDFFPAGDGSYVIALNLAKGKNLDEIVSKKGPIHPEDVCWITQRLLNALHYLHANGIVHCDVKPENIILQPEIHNIALIDYGLSAFRPKHDTSPLGYTKAYAAPELLQNKPPIPESDLYGVGMVMLHALGGDVLAKNFPKHVPDPVKQYAEAFLKYNPVDRPNWEKENLIQKLSDIREAVFGRRHTM